MAGTELPAVSRILFVENGTELNAGRTARSAVPAVRSVRGQTQVAQNTNQSTRGPDVRGRQRQDCGGPVINDVQSGEAEHDEQRVIQRDANFLRDGLERFSAIDRGGKAGFDVVKL